MDIREQFKAARHYLRTEPSLFNPIPHDVPAPVWHAAKASMVRLQFKWEHREHFRARQVGEWVSYTPRVTYGCQCASCMFTNRHARIGFEKWPSDEPKGAKRSASEYTSHVSHLWSGVDRRPVAFKPGQAPIYPSVPGLVHPVADNTAVIRWNAKYCKKYVPEPEPVKIPTMIDMARQMREQARAERKAIKEWAKQLRAA